MDNSTDNSTRLSPNEDRPPCPVCGTISPAGHPYCDRCGSLLPTAPFVPSSTNSLSAKPDEKPPTLPPAKHPTNNTAKVLIGTLATLLLVAMLLIGFLLVNMPRGGGIAQQPGATQGVTSGVTPAPTLGATATLTPTPTLGTTPTSAPSPTATAVTPATLPVILHCDCSDPVVVTITQIDIQPDKERMLWTLTLYNNSQNGSTPSFNAFYLQKGDQIHDPAPGEQQYDSTRPSGKNLPPGDTQQITITFSFLPSAGLTYTLVSRLSPCFCPTITFDLVLFTF